MKPRVLLTTMMMVGFASVSDARGQDMKESRVAPITVEVNAQLIPVGSPLTIRGHTIARDATKPFNLKLCNPKC